MIDDVLFFLLFLFLSNSWDFGGGKGGGLKCSGGVMQVWKYEWMDGWMDGWMDRGIPSQGCIYDVWRAGSVNV